MPSTPQSPPDRAPVKKWAKVRLWAGYVFLLLALIFAQPKPLWMAIGIALVLLGIWIRLVATATLIKDTELCRTGIYGSTRNPLYLGSGLIGLGVASITSSWWFLLGFFLVLAPLYYRMILIEEKYLSSLYPDSLPQYMKAVPRFFPRLSELKTIPGTLDTSRLKKSREISTSIITLVVAILIVAIHYTSWFPGQ